MIHFNGKLSCYLLRQLFGPRVFVKINPPRNLQRALSPGGTFPLTGQVAGQKGNNFVNVDFESGTLAGPK